MRNMYLRSLKVLMESMKIVYLHVKSFSDQTLFRGQISPPVMIYYDVRTLSSIPVAAHIR